MWRAFDPFEPSTTMDSGTTITTSNEGVNSGTMYLEVRVADAAEEWDRLSNEAADRAMEFGLAGYNITAEYAAALADAYAQLADVSRWAKDTKESLRRIA